MDDVQRIFGDADNVLAGRRQAGINLKDLLERRRVLVAVLVQNGVLVLSLDELALLADAGVVVVEHDGAVLLECEGRGVVHRGGMGGDGLVGGLLLLHSE